MGHSTLLVIFVFCVGSWIQHACGAVLDDLSAGFAHSWTFGSTIGNGTIYMTGLDGGLVPGDMNSANNYLMTLSLEEQFDLNDLTQYKLELIDPDVPTVKDNALWSNEDASRLFLYGGRGPTPNVTVPDEGVWEYEGESQQWTLDQSVLFPHRYQYGVYVDVPQIDKHYWIGGYFFLTNSSSSRIVDSGTVQFATDMINFSTNQVGVEEVNAPFLPVTNGGVVFLNISGNPLLVYMGGESASQTTGVLMEQTVRTPNPWNYVWVYNINADRWYKQTVTGTVVPRRTQFCVQAIPDPESSSYQIYVIGGSDFHTQDVLTDVAILTVPSFQWFPATSLSVQRMSINCVTYGSQIFVIGGRREDSDGAGSGDFESPAFIYDVAKQEITTSFDPRSTAYKAPESIATHIRTAPYPSSWDDPALGALFTGMTRSGATTTPDQSTEDNALSTGAQAGIGVGVGLGGFATIITLVWFVLRRRKTAKDEKEEFAFIKGEVNGVDDPESQTYTGRVVHERRPLSFGGAQNPAEISVDGMTQRYELPAGSEIPAEIDSRRRHEAPGNEETARYEAPGDEAPRHEAPVDHEMAEEEEKDVEDVLPNTNGLASPPSPNLTDIKTFGKQDTPPAQ